jgi:hypothetical protein
LPLSNHHITVVGLFEPDLECGQPPVQLAAFCDQLGSSLGQLHLQGPAALMEGADGGQRDPKIAQGDDPL